MESITEKDFSHAQLIEALLTKPDSENAAPNALSWNSKAARVMKELYGSESPGFRCAAHAADGSLKCIAKSETMCAEEVKSFYKTLRSVVHFFQYSGKGKEALDQVIETVEM